VSDARRHVLVLTTCVICLAVRCDSDGKRVMSPLMTLGLLFCRQRNSTTSRRDRTVLDHLHPGAQFQPCSLLLLHSGIYFDSYSCKGTFVPSPPLPAKKNSPRHCRYLCLNEYASLIIRLLNIIIIMEIVHRVVYDFTQSWEWDSKQIANIFISATGGSLRTLEGN